MSADTLALQYAGCAEHAARCWPYMPVSDIHGAGHGKTAQSLPCAENKYRRERERGRKEREGETYLR